MIKYYFGIDLKNNNKQRAKNSVLKRLFHKANSFEDFKMRLWLFGETGYKG